MIPPRVVFVDTSIIIRLIGMRGRTQAQELANEFQERSEAGERFIFPVTALIEAGRLVARQSDNRRTYASRLANLIEDAHRPGAPWIVREVKLDPQFVDEMLAGDSTGSDLVTLLAEERLSTGDVAILVERDQYKRSVAHEAVEVWTLDQQLLSYS